MWLITKINHAGLMLRQKGFQATWDYLMGVYFTLFTGIPILKYSAVTQLMHVGAQHRKLGKYFLSRHNFKAIVSMRHEFDDAARGLALPDYCRPVAEGNDLIEHLILGVIFLTKMDSANKKTYLHCHSGIHRAPMLAIAFLVSQGQSLDAAIEQVLAVRPFCTIDLHTRQQLHHFEIAWFERLPIKPAPSG